MACHLNSETREVEELLPVRWAGLKVLLPAVLALVEVLGGVRLQ